MAPKIKEKGKSRYLSVRSNSGIMFVKNSKYQRTKCSNHNTIKQLIEYIISIYLSILENI